LKYTYPGPDGVHDKSFDRKSVLLLLESYTLKVHVSYIRYFPGGEGDEKKPE